jgi:hypothetical protein
MSRLDVDQHAKSTTMAHTVHVSMFPVFGVKYQRCLFHQPNIQRGIIDLPHCMFEM